MAVWRSAVRRSGFVQIRKMSDAVYGNLFAGEVGRQIPFPIRRVYFINNLCNPKAVRGSHAHRQLCQVIFAVNGSFHLHLDDGHNECDIVMDDPSVGVLLEPMLWHTMSDYSVDCVILVLASDYYDESDYIRDYGAFKSLAAPA